MCNNDSAAFFGVSDVLSARTYGRIRKIGLVLVRARHRSMDSRTILSLTNPGYLRLTGGALAALKYSERSLLQRYKSSFAWSRSTSGLRQPTH